MLKLDIGAGSTPLPGHVAIDRKTGGEAYPLAFEDGVADEIHASHVLEHFPSARVRDVLADWVRVLKPGGVLKVAVPDFDRIVDAYGAGQPIPTEGYIMGGQADPDDYHRALFTRDRLRQDMAAAGLVLLRDWVSDRGDCAALPISLNVQGTKPFVSELKVSAAMSVPRLGFMDNFFCAFEGLSGFGIPIRRHMGAFWGQCLERTIEEILGDGQVDYILTLDYDTVFTRGQLATLVQLAMVHPEAAAIAPIQSARHRSTPLFTLKQDDYVDGKVGLVDPERFTGDLTPARTAHFGLTLLRADRVAALPKPWFKGEPDDKGGWGDGRTDDDVWFWRRWEEAGNSLFVANRVPVGHIEAMIRWPGWDMQSIYQTGPDFREQGAPARVWR